MMYLSVFVILFLSSSVLSEEEKLFTTCDIHDVECLKKTTQEFLENTSSGSPADDIKPFDPLNIPNLDIKPGEPTDILMHFKDITITGLKHLQFSSFDVDTTAKTVMLQTKADLNIVGELTLEMKKTSKLLTGSYSAQGTALGTTKYDYTIETDDEGVEHFVVGPETNECQTMMEPQVTYGQELIENLEKDEDLQEEKQRFHDSKKEIEQRVFCEIVSAAYKTVVHNIRASAKMLPKSSFLKGV